MDGCWLSLRGCWEPSRLSRSDFCVEPCFTQTASQQALPGFPRIPTALKCLLQQLEKTLSNDISVWSNIGNRGHPRCRRRCRAGLDVHGRSPSSSSCDITELLSSASFIIVSLMIVIITPPSLFGCKRRERREYFYSSTRFLLIYAH